LHFSFNAKNIARRWKMIKLAAVLCLAAITLGSQPGAALADDVPTYDVRSTCRAETHDDPGAGTAAACLADEQKARETLVAQWGQFTPESKRSCAKLEGVTAGIRSYVELLTCLQIAKDAKGLPKE
jgi:hypothetical protein